MRAWRYSVLECGLSSPYGLSSLLYSTVLSQMLQEGFIQCRILILGLCFLRVGISWSEQRVKLWELSELVYWKAPIYLRITISSFCNLDASAYYIQMLLYGERFGYIFLADLSTQFGYQPITLMTKGCNTPIVLYDCASKTFFISFQSNELWTIFQLLEREQLTLSMNYFNIQGVQPLFLNPRIVSNRGSSQPLTTFLSMKSLIFLLERTLPSMFNLEYSQTTGLYNPSRSRKVQQSYRLTSNYNEQREQSMFSKLSQIP